MCDRRCRLVFSKERFHAKVLIYAHRQTPSTFRRSISKRKSQIGKIAYHSFPNQLVFGFTVSLMWLVACDPAWIPPVQQWKCPMEQHRPPKKPGTMPQRHVNSGGHHGTTRTRGLSAYDTLGPASDEDDPTDASPKGGRQTGRPST